MKVAAFSFKQCILLEVSKPGVLNLVGNTNEIYVRRMNQIA